MLSGKCLGGLGTVDAGWRRCPCRRGEAEAVAVSVRLGQFHRIIGSDGVPLVTADGTRLIVAERRLAEGETGVVRPRCR